MARLARWHIWLAWLAGVPVLIWTITGLVMVSRPIEEVRGEHLRREAPSAALPQSISGRPASGDSGITEMRAFMLRGKPVMLLSRADGSAERRALPSGNVLGPVSAQEAAEAVRSSIKGGGQITSVRLFKAGEAPPSDYRKASPIWQAKLADGTHIYINYYSGEIAAIRTPFWRVFDFMWGLHIMDLGERENTHHLVLIIFASLGALLSLLGLVLMFRRRPRFIRRSSTKSTQ